MGQEPGSKVGTLQRRKKGLAEGSDNIPKVERARRILQRCVIFCNR